MYAMPQRTLVLHPLLKADRAAVLDAPYRLEEAVSLTQAIDLECVHSEIVQLSKITPATHIGKGKLESCKGLVAAEEIVVVVVDAQLSPIQQRNLEMFLQCKVIDRTSLILEIFGARARTKEGQLQVELAALEYQKTRLVRSWTHLERQRGGFGFTGGPGETQLEIDRRIINDRIAKIKGQLSTVTRTRQLHRESRRSVPYPIVALVGYTNAGKSTLFNTLTGADVFAEDLLFATLDPSMRLLKLPSGRRVILSDTVGFISHLPTELVAAFRATLEEVVEANLLLHVRDVSHPRTEQQKEDVEGILTNLGMEEKMAGQMIEVLNKVDLLGPEIAENLRARTEDDDKNVAISAMTRQGLDRLLTLIDQHLRHDLQEYHLRVSITDGKALAWLYAHAEIIERRDTDDIIFLVVRMGEKERALWDGVLA